MGCNTSKPKNEPAQPDPQPARSPAPAARAPAPASAPPAAPVPAGKLSKAEAAAKVQAIARGNSTRAASPTKAATPEDVKPNLLEAAGTWMNGLLNVLKQEPEHWPLFEAKMKAEGLNDSAISAFKYTYEKLAAGGNLDIPESAIEAVGTLPS